MIKQAQRPKTIIRKEQRCEGEYRYTYLMFSRESNLVSGFGMQLYSIAVELKDGDGKVTKSQIGDVFANLSKANKFFDKLVSNLATPIDLHYALEDEIS